MLYSALYATSEGCHYSDVSVTMCLGHFAAGDGEGDDAAAAAAAAAAFVVVVVVAAAREIKQDNLH